MPVFGGFPPPSIAAKSFANIPARRRENTAETTRGQPLTGRGLGGRALADKGAPQLGMTKEEGVEQRGALTQDRQCI